MDNIEGYHFVCIFLLPTVTNITLFPQITANILEYCQYCQYRVSNHSIIQPCNTPVGIDYTFRPSSYVIYLVLPPGDIPETPCAQSLLQLPGPAALGLLQGRTVHGLWPVGKGKHGSVHVFRDTSALSGHTFNPKSYTQVLQMSYSIVMVLLLHVL